MTMHIQILAWDYKTVKGLNCLMGSKLSPLEKQIKQMFACQLVSGLWDLDYSIPCHVDTILHL